MIARYEKNEVVEVLDLPAAIIIGTTSHGVQNLARMLELFPDQDWREYVACPSPIDIPALRKEAIAAISRSAKDYVEGQANAALQDDLRILAALPAPNQMVLDILAWGRSVYREAEIRKAQVNAGLCDDGDYSPMIDFSMFGEKPHTVGDLWMAGLIQL